MEYCFLTRFLVVLLIQHCTSEGPSTSIQSSTAVTLTDGPATPKELELPPAEVVPAVAPPSLKEVQQAVQEASEQVEARGAEEVLKELLERVVEAARGQAEVGGEAKADEEAVREAAEEDAPEAEKGEAETDTEAEMLEQAVEEVEGEDMGAEGGYDGAGEEQEVAVEDALVIAEEGQGVVEGEGETGAGSVEETTGGVEADIVEVIDESLGIGVIQRIVEDTVAALEETGGSLAVGEAGPEDGEEQAVLSEENAAAETELQEVEETPAVVGAAAGGGPETAVESDPGVAVADVEQIGDAQGYEETLVDEMKVNAIDQQSDDLEIETTQKVVGEPVEEVNIATDDEGPEVEGEQGLLVVGEGAAEDVGAEGMDMGEVSVIKGESAALEDEGGDQLAGEKEQIALETSQSSEKEDQANLEVPVISAPEPEDGEDEASVEPSPENQAPAPGPGGAEPGEKALGEETTNNGNDIIAPTDDLSPRDAVEAQPTLDDIVKGVLAEIPQAEGEEPGEANELVEDAAGNKETSEPGLEAWKIGAISATALLVLETVIIIIYILKCHNKNSTPALQRACEEGCVEPEAATGGDCNDDTLHAANGDAQQYGHT